MFSFRATFRRIGKGGITLEEVHIDQLPLGFLDPGSAYSEAEGYAHRMRLETGEYWRLLKVQRKVPGRHEYRWKRVKPPNR